jgi:preprotein translocase subunit YajC
MELTVTGGLPTAPALPLPHPDPVQYQGPEPSEPPTGVMQSAVAQSGSPQQWPEQQWPPQPIPPQAWPQPVPPQQVWPQPVSPQQWSQPGPPQHWESAGATSAAWAAAPAVALAPAVPTAKRRSGRARAVDLVFGLSMLVAVGGVAFAVGRATAPPSTASNAALAGLGNFPNRSNPNAVVPPAATSAPIAQQVAPSGAPVMPSPGTGTGTGVPQGLPPGGFGRGGLTGIVSALGDGTITYTTADGQTTEVTTSDATTYHQQAAATVADVTVGSSVTITPAGGFGGGGGLSASDVEILLPTQSDGTSTTGAADPGRGFGRGGLTGTVSAVADGTISIATATGQTLDVTTTDTTTYHQQAAADAADVVVGSSIRITAAGGFGGPGAPAASPGAAVAAITASDVEVLLPAGQ